MGQMQRTQTPSSRPATFCPHDLARQVAGAALFPGACKATPRRSTASAGVGIILLTLTLTLIPNLARLLPIPLELLWSNVFHHSEMVLRRAEVLAEGDHIHPRIA